MPLHVAQAARGGLVLAYGCATIPIHNGYEWKEKDCEYLLNNSFVSLPLRLIDSKLVFLFHADSPLSLHKLDGDGRGKGCDHISATNVTHQSIDKVLEQIEVMTEMYRRDVGSANFVPICSTTAKHWSGGNWKVVIMNIHSRAFPGRVRRTASLPSRCSCIQDTEHYSL